MTSGSGMKCRRCKEPAVIELRRHNAAFCAPCFLRHCREQVRKTVEEYSMFEPDDRVLVAVSGGKDSLGLWDLLIDLGYQVDGLYLGLGIEGDAAYSTTSGSFARGFAATRQAKLVEIDLPTAYGYDIPTGAAAARRAPCSACGLSKRHLFNSAALEGGYDVVATGHNLDDEAAVLFGNTLRWNTEYLGRQLPVLPAGAGFVKKVKPLVRLGERELAAYCVLRGIDYIVEECPMAEGNRHLGYKEALNKIEEASPGAKHAFYFEFLANASELFRPLAVAEHEGGLHPCERCGSPTTGEVCAFCSLVSRATDPARVAAVQVTMGRRRGRRSGGVSR
ncbi:MAG: ATP-binding protein [Acidimicrobiales bacterium]